MCMCGAVRAAGSLCCAAPRQPRRPPVPAPINKGGSRSPIASKTSRPEELGHQSKTPRAGHWRGSRGIHGWPRVPARGAPPPRAPAAPGRGEAPSLPPAELCQLRKPKLGHGHPRTRRGVRRGGGGAPYRLPSPHRPHFPREIDDHPPYFIATVGPRKICPSAALCHSHLAPPPILPPSPLFTSPPPPP